MLLGQKHSTFIRSMHQLHLIVLSLILPSSLSMAFSSPLKTPDQSVFRYVFSEVEGLLTVSEVIHVFYDFGFGLVDFGDVPVAYVCIFHSG